jgi:hypothetical protein
LRGKRAIRAEWAFSFSSKTNLPKDFKNGNPTKEAQIENQVRKCNLVTYF